MISMNPGGARAEPTTPGTLGPTRARACLRPCLAREGARARSISYGAVGRIYRAAIAARSLLAQSREKEALFTRVCISAPVGVMGSRIRRRLHHLRSAMCPTPAQNNATAAATERRGEARTPFEWGAEEWQRLEQQRRPIFDDKRIAQIDRRQFLEDGFVLLDGIMTDHGRRAWTAALQHGQEARDAMIRENWIKSIDWKALFRASPPTARPTAEQILAAEGCTQEPPGDESCGTTTLKNHGIFIDHFSAGHLPFLMDVLTHQQMLQLQRALLGCEHVLLDHNSLLNRKGGYQGGGWHSHSMNSKSWAPMTEFDDGQPVTPELYLLRIIHMCICNICSGTDICIQILHTNTYLFNTAILYNIFIQ